MPRPRFTPEERTPGTHCSGGWVGHRAGLDTEDRGKILCPCRGSNPDSPVVQPVVRHYTAWANPAPLYEKALYNILYTFLFFILTKSTALSSIRECLSYIICSLKILNPILRLFSFWITVAKKRRIHSLLRDPKSISHRTIVPSLLINFQLRRWFLFSVERETSGKGTDAASSKRHNTFSLKFPPSFYTAKVSNLQLIPHTSWTAKCLNFSIPLYETHKNLPTSSLHM
jgi:hypothetical protein